MWFDCTKTALKKLKVAYNNSLRRFMGLPWRNSVCVCVCVCVCEFELDHLMNYLECLCLDFDQG